MQFFAKKVTIETIKQAERERSSRVKENSERTAALQSALQKALSELMPETKNRD